jgi:hypothetical protein
MPANKNDTNRTAWEIGNWMINPSDPDEVVSCDNLPGSVLVPLNNSYNVPVSEGSPTENITYTLQDPSNVVYTAVKPELPYKCVIADDKLCRPYNQDGKVYRLRGGLCVRMDVSPDFEPNDDWYDNGGGVPMQTWWTC